MPLHLREHKERTQKGNINIEAAGPQHAEPSNEHYFGDTEAGLPELSVLCLKN